MWGGGGRGGSEQEQVWAKWDRGLEERVQALEKPLETDSLSHLFNLLGYHKIHNPFNAEP